VVEGGTFRATVDGPPHEGTDGAQLAFMLDEATQGSLDVRLTLAGGFARCLSFGGTALRDEPGQFIAKDAAAPASCAGGL
jgi:hypothetical protein